jgi:hypothetical protein
MEQRAGIRAASVEAISVSPEGGRVLLLFGLLLGAMHLRLLLWWLERPYIYDEQQFLALGRALLSSGRLALWGYPTSFRMPGYPFLVMLVGGGWALLVVQLGLYLLSGALLHRYIESRSTRHRAWSCTLLYWAHPIALHFVYVRQCESLQISLFALGVVLWLRGRIVLGWLPLAWCILLKYPAVIYVGMAAILFTVQEVSARRPRSVRAAVRGLLNARFLLAGLLLLLVPLGWYARNAVRGFPLLGTNRLFNFYVGGNPGVHPELGESYDFPWETRVEFFRPGRELEDCERWRRRGRQWRDAQPLARLARLRWNKLCAAFGDLFPSLEALLGVAHAQRSRWDWRSPYPLIFWLVLNWVILGVITVRFVVSLFSRGFEQRLAGITTLAYALLLSTFFLQVRFMAALLGLWALSMGTARESALTGRRRRLVQVLAAAAFVSISVFDWFVDYGLIYYMRWLLRVC